VLVVTPSAVALPLTSKELVVVPFSLQQQELSVDHELMYVLMVDFSVPPGEGVFSLHLTVLAVEPSLQQQELSVDYELTLVLEVEPSLQQQELSVDHEPMWVLVMVLSVRPVAAVFSLHFLVLVAVLSLHFLVLVEELSLLHRMVLVVLSSRLAALVVILSSHLQELAAPPVLHLVPPLEVIQPSSLQLALLAVRSSLHWSFLIWTLLMMVVVVVAHC
jgi:hypothetical protein